MAVKLADAYFKIIKCIEGSNYFQLIGSIPNMLETFKKIYGEGQEYNQLFNYYKRRLIECETKTNV
jgi:hypothetical protein